MKIHVIVCQQWLRGSQNVSVIGAYRSEDDAWNAIRDDDTVDPEGARFGYRVVEIEVASRWERVWRWLESWVDPTPHQPGGWGG